MTFNKDVGSSITSMATEALRTPLGAIADESLRTLRPSLGAIPAPGLGSSMAGMAAGLQTSMMTDNIRSLGAIPAPGLGSSMAGMATPGVGPSLMGMVTDTLRSGIAMDCLDTSALHRALSGGFDMSALQRAVYGAYGGLDTSALRGAVDAWSQFGVTAGVDPIASGVWDEPDMLVGDENFSTATVREWLTAEMWRQQWAATPALEPEFRRM